MSYTKSVFYVPLNTTTITLVPVDDGLSISENDALQADGGAALSTGGVFQVLNKRYSSPRLSVDDITKAAASVYSAGTSQAQVVDIVRDPATETAYIKVIDVTGGREKFSIITAEFNSSVDDATAAADIAAAIAKIDGILACTAAVAAVTITADIDRVFRFATNKESSLGTATAPVFSLGSPKEVNEALAEGLAYQGITNQGGANIVKPVLPAGVNSDKVTIQVDTKVGARIDRHDIVIYIAEGGTTAAYAKVKTVFGL